MAHITKNSIRQVEEVSTPVAQLKGESAALTAAKATAKPNPLSKAMLKLYLICFLAYLNSAINGYDGSLMGAINSMPEYQKSFHMKTLGSSTGIVFAIYSIGQLIGAFFAGPVADQWGRRWGMAVASFIIVVGTAIECSAHEKGQFMAGRFIVGFGVAIVTSAAPAYVVEMAHPAYRGVMTGAYNICYYLGAIVAAWTTYGTQNMSSSWAWRLPVLLQAVPSGIVCIFCLFLPETPRWLASRDQLDKATAVIAKYHGEGDINHPLVALQVREIIESQEQQHGSSTRWWDYRELFSNRANRYRSFIVVAIGFFGQWSGNGIATYYFPAFLNGAGITSEKRVLLFNSIQPMLSFFAALAGTFLTDRVGRRPLLFYCTSACIGFWIIIGVCSDFFSKQPDNTSLASAAIAFIYLFMMMFSFGYTPVQALYPVECLAFETRAKGMGMYAFFVNVAAIVNQYGISVGMEKIAWKFYFIYVGWDVIEAATIWFTFPETKGRTLEELDEIFASPNPVKLSLQKRVVVVDATGDFKVEA